MLQSPQEDLRRLGAGELERAGHAAAGLSPPTPFPSGSPAPSTARAAAT